MKCSNNNRGNKISLSNRKKLREERLHKGYNLNNPINHTNYKPLLKNKIIETENTSDKLIKIKTLPVNYNQKSISLLKESERGNRSLLPQRKIIKSFHPSKVSYENKPPGNNYNNDHNRLIKNHSKKINHHKKHNSRKINHHKKHNNHNPPTFHKSEYLVDSKKNWNRHNN